MSDFEDIIKRDPVLTMRILKLANSTFYSFPTQIETIVQALTLIGVNQLRQLLMGSYVVQYFEDITESFTSMESFWLHSIACGIAAKELAIQYRLSEPERYFVAGLIHAIGRLVILLRAPSQSAEIMARQLQKKKPLFRVERDILGFDHSHVGSELVREWSLPPYLENALLYQHIPSRCTLFAEEATLVHVADIIVNAMQLGNSGERFVPPFDTEAWNKLNMPAGAFRTCVREVDRQYAEVMHVFLEKELTA